GGITNGDRVIRYIVNNNGTGSDGSPGSDFLSRDYNCACSDKSAFANCYRSAYHRTGGKMDVVTDDAVVVNRRSRIDDNVVAYVRLRLYDRAVQNHITAAYSRAR